MVSLKADFVLESACTSCWFVELGNAEPTDLIQEQLQQFLLCLTNWPITQNKVGHEQFQACSSVKKSHAFLEPVCSYHIRNCRFYVSPTCSVKLKFHYLHIKKACCFPHIIRPK